MSKARQEMFWAPFSWLMSLLANINRDPKKGRRFEPADFNPFMAKRSSHGIPLTAKNIKLLKGLFCKKKKTHAKAAARKKR